MLQEVIRRDPALKEQVITALRLDPRVDDTTIAVNVIDGIVSLYGSVNRYEEKLLIQEIAHEVAGVLDIANEITVRAAANRTCTGTEIALAARRALSWLDRVPATEIRTSVTNGWITLEGRVPTWHARLDAEGVVKYLRGVRGVLNLITVQTTTTGANAISRAMNEKLERQPRPAETKEADRLPAVF